jgi:MYXO-CTERM domain-containing protein
VTAGTTIPGSAFAILDSVAQLSTVWSIVYLPTNGTIHFRTAAMAKVKTVSLGSFSFACGGRKILDIDTDATGDVGSMFGDYTAAANLQLLSRSLANLASTFPPTLISLVAAYPDSCRCVTGDAGTQGGDASDGAIGGAPAGGSGGAGAPGTGGTFGDSGGLGTGGVFAGAGGYGMGNTSGGSGGGGNAGGGTGDAVATGGAGAPLAGGGGSNPSGSGGALGGSGGSSSISNNKGGCSCRVGGGRADSDCAIALAMIGLLTAAARRQRSQEVS